MKTIRTGIKEVKFLSYKVMHTLGDFFFREGRF